MPFYQAFLERLLLFRHQTWEDLIFPFFGVCIFFIDVIYFLKIA